MEPDSDDGRVVEVDGAQVLRFERRYEFPISEVWDAIIDPERSGRWMFSTSFEPRVGGRVVTDLGELGLVEGVVLQWQAPYLLEYEWTESFDGGGPPQTWRIRFSLGDVGGATRLVFDHFLPDPRRPEFAAGWHWYLGRLAALLGGSPPASVQTDAEFDRLLARYRAAPSGS